MPDQRVKKNQFLSNQELRLVAISLSILSLGLAIAYIGFLFLSS